jgi:hypothetical protein
MHGTIQTVHTTGILSVKIGNYEVSGVGDEEADEEIPGSCIW